MLRECKRTNQRSDARAASPDCGSIRLEACWSCVHASTTVHGEMDRAWQGPSVVPWPAARSAVPIQAPMGSLCFPRFRTHRGGVSSECPSLWTMLRLQTPQQYREHPSWCTGIGRAFCSRACGRDEAAGTWLLPTFEARLEDKGADACSSSLLASHSISTNSAAGAWRRETRSRKPRVFVQ